MTVHAAASPTGSSCSQTGMVLLLCLIFLMALTLLGLTASADAILQNKLASNLKDSERAKQSALLALTWAENWLLEFEGAPPESCLTRCDGIYVHVNGGLSPRPESENYSWWIEQGHEAGIDPLTGERTATISSDSAYAPFWVIESVQNIPPSENGTPELQTWYRILARGSGQTDAAVSVVESIIARSWPDVGDTGSADTAGQDPCPGAEPSSVCGRFAWRELR